ncbi:unnamed protein product, partial [marine sediment metagenome]
MAGSDCLADISTTKETGCVDPRGRKWVIIWFEGWCEWPKYYFHCITDVPIILWANIGDRTPWKRAGTHFKRGVAYHHAAELHWFYRLVWCQDEEGESYHHTFHFPLFERGEMWWLPLFKSGETFWWRCG